MPQPTATAILQLCLLLSAIPIQYFICQWYGTNSAERLKIIERTINFWDNFKQSYMSLDAWLDQAKIWKAKARAWYIADPLQSENPSSEGDEDNYYFAESNEIRSPKPKVVKFSVGQVIVHRIFGYSGVIIGWDVKAKAPAEWLNQKYREDKEDRRNIPHYRILVNRAKKSDLSSEYVSEDEIAIITGLQIHHPDLEVYFGKYDGSKYIMEPWLKKKYPHD